MLLIILLICSLQQDSKDLFVIQFPSQLHSFTFSILPSSHKIRELGIAPNFLLNNNDDPSQSIKNYCQL